MCEERIIKLVGGPLDGLEHPLPPETFDRFGIPNTLALPNDAQTKEHWYGLDPGNVFPLTARFLETRDKPTRRKLL